MKITCPKDPEHKRFEVSAHVTEPWIVDHEGQFVQVVDDSITEVVNYPNSQDYYVCAECGEDAQATP